MQLILKPKTSNQLLKIPQRMNGKTQGRNRSENKYKKSPRTEGSETPY